MKTSDTRTHSSQISRPAKHFFQSERDHTFFSEVPDNALESRPLTERELVSERRRNLEAGREPLIRRTPAFENERESDNGREVLRRASDSENHGTGNEGAAVGESDMASGSPVRETFRATSADDTGFFQPSARPFFGPAPARPQPRLTIGSPDDRFEQEAEAMADRVVSRREKIRSVPPPTEHGTPGKLAGREVQRQSRQASPPVTPGLEGRLAETRGRGRRLDAETRVEMESAFDTDFSGVRIHTGPDAAQLSTELGAQAFTHGSDVYFNQGKYRPETSEGQHLLAHELTHTIQQQAARPRRENGVDRRVQTDDLERQPGPGSREEGAPRSERSVKEDADSPVGVDGARQQSRKTPGTDRPTGGGEPAPESPRISDAAVPTPQDESASTVAAPGEIARERAAGEEGSEPARESSQAAGGISSPRVSEDSPAGPTVAAPPSAFELPGVSGFQDGRTLTEIPEPQPVVPEGTGEIGPGRAAEAVEAIQQQTQLYLSGLQEAAGTLKADLVRATETTIAQIQSEHQNAANRLQDAFTEQIVRVRGKSQTALTRLREESNNQRQRISTAAQAQQERLSSNHAARRQAATAHVESAATEVQRHADREASRATAESTARADRVRRLSETYSGSGERPLAEAQQSASTRIATRASEQFVQSGEEIARRVDTESRVAREAIRGHLQPYLSTLDQAAVQGRAQITASEAGALAEAERRFRSSQRQVQIAKTEAVNSLEQRRERALTLAAELTHQAIERVYTTRDSVWEEIAPRIGAIQEGFLSESRGVRAAFTEVEELPDDAAERAEAAVLERLATEYGRALDGVQRLRTDVVGPIEGIASGYAVELSQAVASTESDIAATVGPWTGQIEEQTASVLTQADQAASSFEERLATGMDLWEARVDEAREQFEADVHGARDETFAGLSGMVEEGMAEQEAKVLETEDTISRSHRQIGHEYERLKAEAESRDSRAGDQVVQGSFLGAIWDFFSGLAEDVLAWFQEALGDIWGTIVGGFLATLLYAVGVIAVVVGWVFAQAVNLVWGFIWGEVVFDVPGALIFTVIGDIIAGILVYGDLRDIFKHVILKWIMGEEITWVDWLIAGMAAVSLLLTVIGVGLLIDVVRGIFKGILKSTVKSILKELTERLGRELAERIIREFGEEGAERLLRELGPDLLRELMEEFGERGLRELVEEFGERGVRELAESFGTQTLKQLVDEFGTEGLERLIGELGRDLVKQLADELGARGLKQLVDEFSERGVRELTEDFTAATIRELAEAFGAQGLKQARDAVGRRVFADLVTEFGAAGLKTAWDEIGEAGMRILTTDLTAAAIKSLYDDLSGLALRNLADGLTGNQMLDLVRNHGLDVGYLKALGEVTGSGKTLAKALTHFGTAGNLARVLAKAHTSGMSAPVLREFLEACHSHGFKQLTEIENFFDRVVAHGTTSDAVWRNVIDWAGNFVAESVGNTTKFGGRTAADASAPVQRALELADGSTVTVTLNNADVLHMASRHTWEFFAMVMSNVKAMNSMWPPGTGRADVLRMATEALQSNTVETFVKTLRHGDNRVVEVTVDGLRHEVRIALNGPNGLVSMYPLASGAGIADVPKNLMKAAIWLWKSL